MLQNGPFQNNTCYSIDALKVELIYNLLSWEFPSLSEFILIWNNPSYFIIDYIFIINLNLQSNWSYQINVVEWNVQYFPLRCGGVQVWSGNNKVPQICTWVNVSTPWKVLQLICHVVLLYIFIWLLWPLTLTLIFKQTYRHTDVFLTSICGVQFLLLLTPLL